MMERKDESYAGDLLLSFIENGELGKILEKYGLNSRRIGEYEKHGGFALLEKPTPELCADRVDNGLRYMHYSGIDTKDCVKDLGVRGDRMVFMSKKAARKFAYGFLKGTASEWGNAEEGLRAQLIARAIKRGLALHVITFRLLYQRGEKEILSTLKASGDKEIMRYLKLAGGELKFRRVSKGGIFVDEKVRYVNPIFVSGGMEIRLMQVDKSYRAAVMKMNKTLKRGYRLKLVE